MKKCETTKGCYKEETTKTVAGETTYKIIRKCENEDDEDDDCEYPYVQCYDIYVSFTLYLINSCAGFSLGACAFFGRILP